MKQVFEAWVEEENGGGTSISFATIESIKDQRAKGLISPSARLLHTVVADTQEEAIAVHYVKMGWKWYNPGEPSRCPRGCGAMFYPEGSGECPNCGKIC